MVVTDVVLGFLHKVLRDATRRRILLLLSDKKALSYVDLLNAVEIEHTGKLNYHIKVLGDLVAKDVDGRYVLSEKGAVAVQLLTKFQQVSSRDSKFEDAARWAYWGMECFIAQGVFAAFTFTWAPQVLVPFWLLTIALSNLTGVPALVAIFSISVMPPLALAWLSKVRLVDPLQRRELPQHIRRWSVVLSVLGVFFGFGVGIIVMGWTDEKIRVLLRQKSISV